MQPSRCCHQSIAAALASCSVLKDLQLVCPPNDYLRRRRRRASQSLEDCVVDVGPATELNGMRGVGKTLSNTPSPDGLGGLPSGGHAQMCFGLMTKRGCNVAPMDEPRFSPNTVCRNLLYILMKGEWYIRNGVAARKIVAGSSLCSVPSKRRPTQAKCFGGTVGHWPSACFCRLHLAANA